MENLVISAAVAPLMKSSRISLRSCGLRHGLFLVVGKQAGGMRAAAGDVEVDHFCAMLRDSSDRNSCGRGMVGRLAGS